MTNNRFSIILLVTTIAASYRSDAYGVTNGISEGSYESISPTRPTSLEADQVHENNDLIALIPTETCPAACVVCKSACKIYGRLELETCLRRCDKITSKPTKLSSGSTEVNGVHLKDGPIPYIPAVACKAACILYGWWELEACLHRCDAIWPNGIQQLPPSSDDFGTALVKETDGDRGVCLSKCYPLLPPELVKCAEKCFKDHPKDLVSKVQFFGHFVSPSVETL